jgi:CRISPR-associated protein Cas1
MRFPGEDVSTFTIQQLRGREGARVRSIYRNLSKETGVVWNGREYDPNDYESGTLINKSLSAAHACLYGIVHSVIVALGCSPGLGFIHSGHERSFVYDIADLYKAVITIPVAFQTVANATEKDDVGAKTRRAVRDAIADGRIMVRIVQDLRSLLIEESEDTSEVNILHLWDDANGFLKSGVNYGGDSDEAELVEGYGSML